MSSKSNADDNQYVIKPRKRRRLLRAFLMLTVCAGAAFGGLLLWEYHPPCQPVEIYSGITYGCERLPDTDDTGGLMHWVRADLKVPGVQLFVTPVDPEAHQHGYEYKLKYTSTAVKDEHLAAAVNGTLFGSDSWFSQMPMPGDYAFSNETVVADHVVNHVHEHSYLVWWGDDLLAHQEHDKPPSERALHLAKWGISGQDWPMIDGHARDQIGLATDKRTMIAADPFNRIVWIACFDKASERGATLQMIAKGAKIGTCVDGGTSVAMAIGDQAKNVRSGTVTGNWRPVATVFGFRANPLP